MKGFRITNCIPIILSSILFAFSSCGDFLDVTPTGRTVTPTAFSDMRGMRSAVNGVYYETYQLYSSNFYAFADLADNIINLSENENAANVRRIYNYDYLTTSSGYWGTIYELLVNVNNIIEYQPSLLDLFPDNKSELEMYKGEALFLRALCHFDLCKLYGQPYNYTADASHLGVPIVLRAPNYDSKPARNTVKEVYAQIIKDLNEAESILADKSSRGKYYVNLHAIYGLKSRVYLYMEDWDNAIKYSSLVIDQIPLAKGNDYTSMYTALKNNETEIIFRLNGALNNSTSLITLYKMTEVRNATTNKIGVISPPAVPSNSYLALFNGDTDDIRFREIIHTATDSLGVVYHATRKYSNDNTDSEYIHFNPIVLRCSEMYLNRAEAYWNKDKFTEAAADIKAIIARAYNKNMEDVSVTTDKDELRKIIEDERTKELGFEGHKLFDTTRWKKDMIRDANTTSNITKLTYPNDLFLQPIPQRELDVNPNMVGNPTVNN